MGIPWHLYLPIAGNSVNVLLVFGMGGAVGLLSGIFGVGGGFLMTPLLIMIGIPSTVAAASDSNQIVGASTSGTIAHFRLGNVDFKMGMLLLIGGVIGGTVGVQIIKILNRLGNADFLIKNHLRSHVGFYRRLYVPGEPPGTAEEKRGGSETRQAVPLRPDGAEPSMAG